MELLSSEHSCETLLSFLTTALIATGHSGRPAVALFSGRSNDDSPPILEIDRWTGRGGGAQLGVSRRGRQTRWLRSSVAAWSCKEAPDGSCFSCFGRGSPPRAHLDRRPGLCDGFRRGAGLRFYHPPRAWRLSCGAKKKWASWFSFAARCACASGLASFVFPPFLFLSFHPRATARSACAVDPRAIQTANRQLAASTGGATNPAYNQPACTPPLNSATIFDYLFRVRELAGRGCSASEPHH